MKRIYKSGLDIRRTHFLDLMIIFFKSRFKRLPSTEEITYILNSFDSGKTFKEVRAEYEVALQETNKPVLNEYLINDNYINHDENLNFRGSITVQAEHGEFICGQVARIPVIISNDSIREWSTDEKNPDNLSYHIFSINNILIVYDGIRTKLQSPIKQNSKLNQNIEILIPNISGDYRVEVTLVKENVNWFETVGFKNHSFQIRVNSLTTSFITNFNKQKFYIQHSSEAVEDRQSIMSPLEFYLSRKNI